ncbi:hypothetical protein ACERK3_15280 [Phycisphaerales bacterium AB-hyl4]|uniref:Terminase small subunit n=1 Tax=Natronomicrosphaera hydrolytica TaxID=3242702 RepID=A0ABV4U963_9BACT
MKRISSKRQTALLHDIFNAEHDVVALAHKHGLKPADLAAWAGERSNQSRLAGLCALADYQTQLLLSRYRLLAANRLIRLATQEDEGTSDDVARRACVDLLKLEMKRASASNEVEAKADPAADADDGGNVESLRKALFDGVDD